MRKTIVRCYCGSVIKVFAFDDDKADIEMTGMCARCVANDGQFYIDPEEERKEREFIAFGKSVKNTKPLRKKKR